MSSANERRMDAATAALPEACGGQPYFWNRGTDARIIAQRSHESSVVVTARPSRVADVPAALRAALVASAPGLAVRRRNEAAEKREAARALLAEANALDEAAQKIDAALAAMVAT